VAKARYLVEAHLLEGRSVAELAAAHGVHRSWIYKLLARYREGGYEALEPRSRAPRRSPNRTSEEVARAVVSLREQLLSQGHDSGAQVSTMTRDICLRCLGTSQNAPSWIRTSGLLLRRAFLSSLIFGFGSEVGLLKLTSERT